MKRNSQYPKSVSKGILVGAVYLGVLLIGWEWYLNVTKSGGAPSAYQGMAYLMLLLGLPIWVVAGIVHVLVVSCSGSVKGAGIVAGFSLGGILVGAQWYVISTSSDGEATMGVLLFPLIFCVGFAVGSVTGSVIASVLERRGVGA